MNNEQLYTYTLRKLNNMIYAFRATKKGTPLSEVCATYNLSEKEMKDFLKTVEKESMALLKDENHFDRLIAEKRFTRASLSPLFNAKIYSLNDLKKCTLKEFANMKIGPTVQVKILNLMAERNIEFSDANADKISEIAEIIGWIYSKKE